MKKNLLILSCFLLCAKNIFSDRPTEIISRIADVLKFARQAKTTDTEQKIMATIKENFVQLSKPFDEPAINADIIATRKNINTTASRILELAQQNTTKEAIQKTVQTLMQDCYRHITKASIYPLIFSKTIELQLNSFTIDQAQEKKLQYQLYDILNRIFLLWHITELIFKFSKDHKFTLQWPTAELTILEWQNITQAASAKLWASLDPAVEMAAAKKTQEEKDKLQEQKLQNYQKQSFVNLQPSDQQLKQFDRMLKIFLDELTNQQKAGHHDIFTKYDFNENLGLAITYLKLIKQKLKNEEQLPKDKILQEIQALQQHFQNQMSKIYSQYFKKELGGHFGNNFLVIKHKFAPKADGTIIPEVNEQDAVMLLTDLIILWELYNTLFPKENEAATISYLKKTFHISRWISETANAGFNQPGQFSDALKNTLTRLLPAEEIDYTGSVQLSKAFQNVKSGITTVASAVKDTAQKTSSAIKEKATATSGWLSSAWNSIKSYVTRRVEEEIDEL